MLNQYKGKIDQDTQQMWGDACLVNETPTHYILHCSELDTQKAKLMKNISRMLRRNIICPFNTSTEE